MDYVIPLRFKQGDHVVVRPDLNINTEDIQYNPANGEQFIDGKKIDVDNPYSKSDDDEKDRYEAFEKDNGVVKVIISRTRERDIHYMV